MNTLPISIVTGGAGFIGSNLCSELLRRGHFVYCVDNLITGSEKNIKPLLLNPNFAFLKHDVINPLPDSFKKKLNPPLFIFHLASPASPPKYKKWSIETMRVNSVGTYNMLNLASDYLYSRFLLASTSEVYGNPEVHPQKENYNGNVNPLGTRACYDESKRFAESLTMEFLRKKNTAVRIVRIFNTYGPNMEKSDGRVVSNFINQALSGQSLTLYGDGSQTRSLCYVSDLVEGIIKMIQKDNINGEVINLGNPNEMKVREIAEIILKLTKSNSQIIKSGEKDADDPKRRKPDISKAKKILGWEPHVSVEEGLLKTIEYFKNI
ncbi:hypothetical protein A3D77_07060 [Candidatus Gottesmanbacteria bacterium RIFCSPHIGHO2_02_FULL_39_11]|uniref:UDP-glucuronate decarboxylase n=1 Tax=Candidatus Gottesmanbacteria bacterium RIFCSPHIGHO2_02_FULL_39_11 TaxID=1798382 RepID=A0A1F5ZJY9_9BACT|nr:MAG: hypothetical protein A3D77_07060 [Candidatus Gottesmanbacteria bacterium RIFCSPHIGHO2_02_FULL_39_11]